MPKFNMKQVTGFVKKAKNMAKKVKDKASMFSDMLGDNETHRKKKIQTEDEYKDQEEEEKEKEEEEEEQEQTKEQKLINCILKCIESYKNSKRKKHLDDKKDDDENYFLKYLKYKEKYLRLQI
jgi:hypothetical protein